MNLLDSLYFSLVTLATLGYGDISPASEWLRVAAPLESLLGLGLLTASVSWLLSIFPVLSRRRALAYEISFHGGLLLRAIDDFAASIATRFRLPNNGSTPALLDAYAHDHSVHAKQAKAHGVTAPPQRASHPTGR